MLGHAKFTIALNLETTNEQRRQMFALYQEAFGATMLSEGTPPDGDDIHIMMDVCGLEILLGPGNQVGRGLDNALVCEVRFDDERDFRRAYDALSREARSHAVEGPYPWATLLGLLTDKFGLGWALYYNEK